MAPGFRLPGKHPNTVAAEENMSDEQGLAGDKMLWVFHIEDEADEDHLFLAVSYDTENHAEACRTARKEYGYKIIGSTLRKLTFHEYSAVLRCNFGESVHAKRVYQAMLRLVYCGTFEYSSAITLPA